MTGKEIRGSRRTAGRLFGWASFMAVSWHGTAAADPPPLARELFESAMAKEQAGATAEACVLYEASAALDAKRGARFKVARCLEQRGRVKEALAVLNELLSAARELPGDDGRAKQREIEDAMRTAEGKVARLRIELPSDLDVVVSVDDQVIPGATVESQIPLDPGPHKVVVVGRGKSVSRSVELAGGAQVTLDLTSEWRAELRTPPPVIVARPLPPALPPTATRSTPWQWGAGAALTTLGVASLGGALALGIQTMVLGTAWSRQGGRNPCAKDSAWNQDLCNLNHQLYADAETTQTAAFVSLGAGAALAAAGVVLLVHFPPSAISARSPAAGVQVKLGPDGMGLRFLW
jgi:hypothetical protein